MNRKGIGYGFLFVWIDKISAWMVRYNQSLCENLVASDCDRDVLHDVFLKMTQMDICPQSFYWQAERMFRALNTSYALDEGMVGERLIVRTFALWWVAKCFFGGLYLSLQH